MRNTKTQLMSTLGAIIRKYKKKYCTASQAKMIELLKMFYGVEIHTRQINYHLADLRAWGLIKTIKRTYRKSDGTLCLQTSATCITPKGYYELWKMGCEWAKKMYDKLIKRYYPEKASKVKIPAPVNQEELDQRRALGRTIFSTEAYKNAFNLNN